MAKAKISKKRGAFSLNKMKVSKLRDGIESVPHSATAALSDEEFIAHALAECVVDCDMAAFKDILRSHYEAMGLTVREAADLAGVGKSTFAEIFEKEGNPRLKTVFSVMEGLRDARRSRRA